MRETRAICQDCIPEAPFDFEGITGAACVRHNGFGKCRCEVGYETHSPGCRKVEVEDALAVRNKGEPVIKDLHEAATKAFPDSRSATREESEEFMKIVREPK